MTGRPAQMRTGRWRRDQGTVLIVTMWVVLVLAGLVLVFSHAARVEAVASANRQAAFQAEAVARGALQYALAAVDGTDGSTEALEAVLGEERRVGGGFFWLLRPNLEDDGQHYFGLTDEASRISLNSASPDILLKLPGVTAELADSIVDWRDQDADVSPSGAESQFYLLLDEPYYCKDAPFEAVEEVLLVRDGSAELLYGEDANRNGVLDANENDADETEPDDNRNGSLDRGFLDYVTVHSVEPNLAADATERINVNQFGTQDLADLLREVVAEDRLFLILQNARRSRPHDNILDFYFRSGLTLEEFASVADRLTTVDEEELRGMVNVNTAPREVLLCLPELDEGDVEALLSARADADTDLGSIAWVADALPEEKATAVGSYVTTRSYQFAADIVAVDGSGRAYRRYHAVIDAMESPPRVVLCQDLTHLGWPLDRQILSDLRAGDFAPATNAMASPR